MRTTALTVIQLLCNLASWFTFYSITRTLSNSTEAALTPVVLYYWLLATQTAGNSDTQKYVLNCDWASVTLKRSVTGFQIHTVVLIYHLLK